MTTEMFSTTDADSGVMIKTAPEQEISVVLAAIIFALSSDEVQSLAGIALEAVRDEVMGPLDRCHCGEH